MSRLVRASGTRQAKRFLRALALLGAFALLVAACADEAVDTTTTAPVTEAEPPVTEAEPPVTEAEPPDETDEEWPPAETTSVVWAIRQPDLNSNAPVVLAVELGYFEEEGLDVQYINVDDVRPALAGGSVQFGVIDPGPVIQAREEGLDFVMLASNRCTESNWIAIAPGIESPEDLIGESVRLGGVAGDPDVEERLALLAESGWDLSDIVDQIDFVTPPGGSDAAVELLLEGRIAVTQVFFRHLEQMREFGATIAVDREIPRLNDVLVVTREFKEQNPATIQRFLRGLLRGFDFYLDLDNKDVVLEIMTDAGWTITEREVEFYEGSPINYCRNLHLQTPYEVYLEGLEADLERVPYEEISDDSYLRAAQESLGLPTGLIPSVGVERGLSN